MTHDIENAGDMGSELTFPARFSKGYECLEKFPDYVPVLFSPAKDVDLHRKSFLTKRSVPLGHLISQFRSNLTEDIGGGSPNASTFGFIFTVQQDEHWVLPRMTETLGELHDKYHGSDMWLTFRIDKEAIFG